ncbi:hypothetical protein [Streptomyces cahuitamycinicus]|uniref:Uncharacterized protein n=1 Tax=Streptomyces cahuitamycinicus TaxID=2070367 RepID=A0A2N8TTH6_9ACTN|nr:hypothetical protein [Streptomyces cahuitamycinicus]PNG22322.1 hypothetical protein C1J00_09920 [Streptomyces cahuitamycinicus]
MIRRRQCPTWSKREIDLQCQRRARHDGPHQASFSDRHPSHFQWENGANRFGYEVRPGTVRYRPGTPSLAYRFGEWTASVLFFGVFGTLLWAMCSPVAAVTYCLVVALLSVQRPHFVDIGRFTAGVFLVPQRNFPPFFAIGFARYGPETDAGRSGLQVIIGRRSLMVCALLPRAEWAEFQRRSAERDAARRKDGAQ